MMIVRGEFTDIVFDVQMGVAGDMFLASLSHLGLRSGIFDRNTLEDLLADSASSMERVVVSIRCENVSGINAAGVFTERDEAAGHSHVSGAEMSGYLKEGARRLGLDGNAKKYADRALDLILNAEAEIHASTPEELHLHETGAPDTLVEIIGSAHVLQGLGAFEGNMRFFSTPVSVGRGSIEISHGTVPVPAPATLEILKEVPFRFGPIDGELATPTGVSLLKALEPDFLVSDSSEKIVPKEIGYGFGKRRYGGKYLNLVRPIGGSVKEP